MDENYTFSSVVLCHNPHCHGMSQHIKMHHLKSWDESLARAIQAVSSVFGRQSSQSIEMSSGISHRTGKGFVSLAWGHEQGQWSVDEARQHAMRLLESAEAAQYDSIFVQWLLAAGLTDRIEKAAELLIMLRAYREQQDAAAFTSSDSIHPEVP